MGDLAPPPQAIDKGYGGFTLGGISLALPMAALREVVPCIALIQLPTAAPCVIGGIDLRGVLVPVIDLRIVLGREASDCARPCVVLMVHGGSILGLLCDGVTGVFFSRKGHLSRATSTSTDAIASLLAGSIRREDDGTLVNVLSPQALVQLPLVPLVVDPEPGRQLTLTDASAVVINDQSVPVMLFRCGQVPLAIDAMSVHATLSEPRVQPSVLARGHCRGVLDYAGQQIPVVDVLGLCGFGEGSAADTGDHHAFVVRLDTGLLAFLVDKVLDVARTLPGDVMRVPAFALPHPRLFAGGLSLSGLPADVVQQFPTAISQFLLLDGAALKTDPQLLELARMGLGEERYGARVQIGASSEMDMVQGTGQRSMVTYQLGVETASPIEQIMEILPYTCDVSIFEVRGALLGLVAHRGRSIPVLCLCRLVGLPSPAVSPAVSVLVVEVDGVLTGFAVPTLRSIESADWEPALPRMGVGGPDELACALQSRQLAQVRGGGPPRMLKVLDLQRVARALHQLHVPVP